MLSIRNIPYLYFQGLPPFLRPDIIKKDRGLEKIYAPSIEQLLFYFLKYENWFDKTKFIGWPGLSITTPKPHWNIFQGYADIRSFNEALKYVISNEDRHPNEKGHQTMAHVFYKNIEELYPHLL